jgi:hypothetical protein
VTTTANRPSLRLAELVATLSLGTDLGLSQPMEHMIRACLVALRLGESFGLSDAERHTVYYSGLLAWVGRVERQESIEPHASATRQWLARAAPGRR